MREEDEEKDNQSIYPSMQTVDRQTNVANFGDSSILKRGDDAAKNASGNNGDEAAGPTSAALHVQSHFTTQPVKRVLLPRTDVPAVSSTQEYMERRKNEIVQEMLQKIKPFVGPMGTLQPDTNFAAFAQLMEAETQFVQRILLMTILNSSTAVTSQTDEEVKAAAMLVSNRISKTPPLMSELYKWLSEAIKNSPPLLSKILELLLRLPFTVDQLVELKLGKLVKRIVSEQNHGAHIQEKAQQLYDAWSRLAKQEDSAKKKKKAEENIKTTANTTTNTKNATSAVVENMELFSDPPTKTRASMILERVVRGDPVRPSALETRPLSADDIHKAKKRQLYLQTKLDDKETVKKPKNRVSFPPDDELCDYYYFEPENEPQISREKGIIDVCIKFCKVDYHRVDKQEASYAFKRLQLDMEPDIEWKTPLKGMVRGFAKHIVVIAIANPYSRGQDSQECKIQQEREKTALSAIYYSLDHVPPSPSESFLKPDGPHPPSHRSVPLYDLDHPTASPVKIIADPITFDPTLLTSLMSNPNVLQDLLKQTSLPFGMPPPMSLSFSSAKSNNGKNLCKYYKPGKQNSCRRGDECTFVHLNQA